MSRYKDFLPADLVKATLDGALVGAASRAELHDPEIQDRLKEAFDKVKNISQQKYSQQLVQALQDSQHRLDSNRAAASKEKWNKKGSRDEAAETASTQDPVAKAARPRLEVLQPDWKAEQRLDELLGAAVKWCELGKPSAESPNQLKALMGSELAKSAEGKALLNARKDLYLHQGLLYRRFQGSNPH